MFEMLTWKEYVKCLTKEILWNVSEERKGKVESCWLTRWYFSPTPMYSSVGLPSWANNDVPEIQFAIWHKWILQFNTNTFCNLRQIYFAIWDKYSQSRLVFCATPRAIPICATSPFAIWDKYILQFKTNIFVNLRKILSESISLLRDYLCYPNLCKVCFSTSHI